MKAGKPENDMKHRGKSNFLVEARGEERDLKGESFGFSCQSLTGLAFTTDEDQMEMTFTRQMSLTYAAQILDGKRKCNMSIWARQTFPTLNGRDSLRKVLVCQIPVVLTEKQMAIEVCIAFRQGV
ncbi:hypothetical protein BUALT_Bualt18G0109700 [Buddleja alternifolia]|uniref:Uncharacterized protein n=1 Tax=Buddleja alternifolia TaxID=168488 RepID=A0AAV6WEV9_9LAMI|nr:hypothetical protein BUALT_Bualt18G0109700 [Buddleja alternifolia]